MFFDKLDIPALTLWFVENYFVVLEEAIDSISSIVGFHLSESEFLQILQLINSSIKSYFYSINIRFFASTNTKYVVLSSEFSDNQIHNLGIRFTKTENQIIQKVFSSLIQRLDLTYSELIDTVFSKLGTGVKSNISKVIDILKIENWIIITNDKISIGPRYLFLLVDNIRFSDNSILILCGLCNEFICDFSRYICINTQCNSNYHCFCYTISCEKINKINSSSNFECIKCHQPCTKSEAKIENCMLSN